MSFINQTKTQDGGKTQSSHLNWMGGRSWDISHPVFQFRLVASSCFFGEPMYYHRDPGDMRPAAEHPRTSLPDAALTLLRESLDELVPAHWRGLTPAELMEQAIDAALAADPEATLQEAARLRQEDRIRTTPQVALVRAANHAAVRGSGLIARYGPQIVQRLDEPATGLAYQLEKFGRPVPNALKKLWASVLAKADEYQLAKYRLDARTVKTLDVVNLCHPKSPAIDKLMRGTLRLDENTWESLISSRGASAETWQQALPLMGHMALLRNLRNLLEHKVPPELFLPALKQGAARGMQLPFRYYSAYCAVKKTAPPSVLDAIEECLVTSLGNLPFFPGRVMSLCDNSGSAQGTATSSMGRVKVSTIANLTAILTAMQSEEGWVGVFGDGLETRPVRKRSSVFDVLNETNTLGKDIGQGTENGIWLFWDKAIREREHWDMVFVYSDMQAGHGGLFGLQPEQYARYQWVDSRYIDVPKLVKEYRRQVNPEVKVFLVQVAGYKDTIMPEFFDRTFILGGWSDGVLRFAAQMAGIHSVPIAGTEDEAA
ncbi:TROVE domain-containing protein [Prosthecobacter sp.]|uniref:TROVE domain-containing protein n=1 Tax=Prosthecobacter sp. TaxID=1965333 RepID=UPI00378371E5